jgi:hypothetical protein
LKTHLKRNEVKSLLDRINEILANEGSAGFTFVQNRTEEKNNPKFTNTYCLTALEYDEEDVMREIMSLQVSNYYESVFDRESKQPDTLHVFVKEIINKQVYIKIKIKEIGDNDIVLCISFHFAEHHIGKLPYE